MSANASARLQLLGVSHHTAPVAIREKLAIVTERVPAFYGGLRQLPGVREALLLSTCNRFEVYALIGEGADEAALDDFVCRFQEFPPAEFLARRFLASDVEAVRHLLEVASGVDSQIVGETEIFGQVKAAYATATTHGTVGAVLNRVCQKTFQAAKFVRTATPIGAGQISIATVAVDLAGKIFGDVAQSRVLVIGTGEIGEKAMKAFHSRGAAAITVLSRTPARAEALAAQVGATPGSLAQIDELLAQHDIVIGCTNSPTPLLTAAMVQAASRQRRRRPLFLIDLAMPRNFEAAAGQIDSVFLYDLDDHVRIADENLAARRAAVARCRQLAQERAERIWKGVEPRLDAAEKAFPAEPVPAREATT